MIRRSTILLVLTAAALAACVPSEPLPVATEGVLEQAEEPTQAAPGATPLPTRTAHPPGELVDYVAQSGDTLPALAERFNTTAAAILEANPAIPRDASTLPVGYPLQIPAYFQPLMGTPFKILPDSEFVNGPTAVGFDLRAAVQGRPGWLASHTDYAYGRERPGWEVVEVVARNYSIHPRLLLTLLEHQAGALTNPFPTEDQLRYPLGRRVVRHQGLYRQLLWAAEHLNNGYYGWRTGKLRELELTDGRLVRPDSWQNAATVGLQTLFAELHPMSTFESVMGPDGLFQTYLTLWGDPFARAEDLIPGNLLQPELTLPFAPGRIWDYTGGPHPTWGDSLPWGALDFAPPAMEGGCAFSNEWIAAPADGLIVRSEPATVVLDLDEDGDERTGWVLLFYHVATEDRVPAVTRVATGDQLGHPSCEGGRSTGTHFHIGRRFNGEWLPAAGPVPFVLDGWVAGEGEAAYDGTLTKGSRVITACPCTTRANRVLYEPDS